ncbi:MAG: hypothetical protein IJX77_10620 [Ruminococcus sp.]|nr:hypothetical protein [Ruminococcus sp.]
MLKFIKRHPYLIGLIIDLTILISASFFVTDYEGVPSSAVIIIMMILVYGSLAGIVLVPVIIWVFRYRKSKRENEEKERIVREYCEKYISEYEVNNSKLGRILFEKDSNKNAYSFIDGDIKKLPLGRESGFDLSIEIKGSEEELLSALDSLAELYENPDKVMDGYYKAVLEQCADWDEEDAQGNPITPEYIAQHFGLELLRMEVTPLIGESSIMLSGAFDDDEILNCHWMTAYIDIETGSAHYQLEG